MPYKDRSEYLRKHSTWMKERTAEYHKWLYQRRSLVKRQRDVYADTLRLLVKAGPADDGPARLAQEALEQAEQLARETGNRFDHEQNRPYWEDE